MGHPQPKPTYHCSEPIQADPRRDLGRYWVSTAYAIVLIGQDHHSCETERGFRIMPRMEHAGSHESAGAADLEQTNHWRMTASRVDAFPLIPVPKARRGKCGCAPRVANGHKTGRGPFSWALRLGPPTRESGHAISHKPQYGTRFEGFGKCSSQLMKRRAAYSVKPPRKDASA